jgi:hypothetical protein
MPWESGAKAKRRNEPAEVALSYWICPLTVKRQGNAAIQLTVKYSFLRVGHPARHPFQGLSFTSNSQYAI